MELPLVFPPLSTHPRLMNLLGQRFGRLVVVGYGGKTKSNALWWCKCDCGEAVRLPSNSLRGGHSKSCDCLMRESVGARFTKHGHNTTKGVHPLYYTWCNMKARCHASKCKAYYLYGARGIKVCQRWRVGENGEHPFVCFITDMGPKPTAKHSIDRINNDGDYEPSNCRWATPTQQVNNRRVSRVAA